MIYLLALIVSMSLGILATRLILQGSLVYDLDIFLGAALGFGIVSQIIFYLQLVGHQYSHFLCPFISIVLLGLLFWANKNIKTTKEIPLKHKSLLILPLLLIPLWFEGNYFHMGGWDAWSCWNLKAKFIYLGQNHWTDLFNPILWRSNTGYPLALPTINVWFWHWTGLSQSVPMLNSIIFTLLTAGVLVLALEAFRVRLFPAIITTLALFSLAFGNTLCVSQYSDILFSLYLLCAFVCYLLFCQNKDQRLLILTGIFIGLLSFTKNEGLAASGIFALLLLLKRPVKPWVLIGVIALAALPTLVFMIKMAPKSQAFINGFISSDKPSSFERLEFILAYTLFEFLSLKWMGIWILAFVGLALGWRKAFKEPLLLIGVFCLCYLGVVLGYYLINTFFQDINWWMNFTLNRILFALMPSIFLWMGISVFKKDV
jgi:hypothetical protein